MLVDSVLGRRDFLATAGTAAAGLIVGCKGQVAAESSVSDVLAALRRNAITEGDLSWSGARDVPDGVRSKAIIATDEDRSKMMAISGTVFAKNGKPAPDTLIYLYHTDVHGIYGREGEHRHGRCRGWLLTDSDGRYSFQTIRPASYPDSTIAAHIHMTVTTTTSKEDWIDSILFEGDKFITERERRVGKGGFDPILKLMPGADGMPAGTRDIQLA
jgi:protocatechuate 3,4-dioxygenase beta subunit